jgi:hypothetical protein
MLAERVIEAEPDGFPHLSRQLVLLDCPLTETAIESRFPNLWRYLEQGKRQQIHETYLTSRRTPWYSQEHRPPPPFLCTYMGRTANGRKPFRFLWNQSQAIAHNVYLLLYPKGELAAMLRRTPELADKVFGALESLNTENITGNGRVYGGGLFKMEPKELASIPGGFVLEAVMGRTTGSRLQQGKLFRLLEKE